MKSVNLGKSEVRCEAVGLGTWAMGGWMWGGNDDAAAVDAIRASLDAGVRMIDSAPAYGLGHAEELVGKAIKEIKEGNPLGIFPEGTRIKREGLGRFHTGMASLALMTGTPVIPVAVLGTMDLPRKNGPLAVLIGKPIEVKKQRPTDEKVAELNDIVKAEIQKLMDDYKK